DLVAAAFRRAAVAGGPARCICATATAADRRWWDRRASTRREAAPRPAKRENADAPFPRRRSRVGLHRTDARACPARAISADWARNSKSAHTAMRRYRRAADSPVVAASGTRLPCRSPRLRPPPAPHGARRRWASGGSRLHSAAADAARDRNRARCPAWRAWPRRRAAARRAVDGPPYRTTAPLQPL